MADKIDGLIIRLVTEHQGLKATKLAVEVASHAEFPAHEDTASDRLVDRIYGLIEEGELVGVDYVLPDLDYRGKTLVLPKGSKVTFVFPKGTRVNLG